MRSIDLVPSPPSSQCRSGVELGCCRGWDSRIWLHDAWGEEASARLRTSACVSVQVRRGGAAGGAERGEASLLLPQPTLAVHAHHAATVLSDGRWHAKLLRSALQLLLRHLVPRLASLPSPSLRPPDTAGVEPALTNSHTAGAAARTARPTLPTVDMACVEPDFMQHHRQLLPSSSLRCEPAAGPAAGMSRSATKGGKAPRGRRRLGALSLRGSRRRLGTAPLTHAQATAALDAMLLRVKENAVAAGCGAHAVLRQEMQLSGLFSMVAGTLKAWTAALRTGRAFLTPLARGLVDAGQCRGGHGHANGDDRSPQPGLRCWFEPLVPECEEGPQSARAPPPHLALNLPQLRRESLATAAAVPAPFDALGAFWWTAQ